MTCALAGIQRVGQTVGQGCANGLAAAGKGIVNGYCWTGRKVEHLCHSRLPETAAKVVSAFIWALPYMLLFLAVPRQPTFLNYLTSGLTIGIVGNNTLIEEDHRQHMARGFRNAAIIKVCIDSVKMILTRDITWIPAIVFNAQMAHMANKCTNPLPPPAPAQEQVQEPAVGQEPEQPVA